MRTILRFETNTVDTRSKSEELSMVSFLLLPFFLFFFNLGSFILKMSHAKIHYQQIDAYL